MFGLIRRQGAAGRLLIAPACISGFGTDNTPFAKGHIMAVELGGWDNSHNIVPQYECWQGLQGGPWRDMEVQIGNNPTVNTMIVRMSYDSLGDTLAVNRARFQNGETLFHWEDSRIPTRFEVWTLTSADPGNYFSSSNANKLLHADTFVNGLGRPTYDHPITAMPAIDRKLWISRFVRGQVAAMYEDYKTEFEQNKLPKAIGSMMASKTAARSTPVKGIAKPARSSTRIKAISVGLVKQPLRNPEWFRVRKLDLVRRILLLPEVANWLPLERASFDEAVMEAMVY